MIDYILELSFESDDALEEMIVTRLFGTASSGSSSREANGSTIISAYFESAGDREAASALFEEHGVTSEMIERPRENWLEHYEQSLHPILIGRRFIVAPDERLIEDPHRLPIVVPQEQAFGTGSHETTALCMETLESLPVVGRRGLDIGSGSGILAIAMLRLGAARAIAFDSDPDAYGALRDNRQRNGIDEPSMPLFIGGMEALRGGTFDVITMNIIPEVILPLLPAVVERMAPSCVLVLSGILVIRRDDVLIAASREGLTLIAERQAGEWWCGSFARRARTP